MYAPGIILPIQSNSVVTLLRVAELKTEPNFTARQRRAYGQTHTVWPFGQDAKFMLILPFS